MSFATVWLVAATMCFANVRNCLWVVAIAATLAGCMSYGDVWGPPPGTKPVYLEGDAALDCKQLTDGINGNIAEIQRISVALDDGSDMMYATGVAMFGIFAVPAMIADAEQRKQMPAAEYARYVYGRIVALKETGKQKGCEKDADFAQALKPTGVNWKRPAPVSQSNVTSLDVP